MNVSKPPRSIVKPARPAMRPTRAAVEALEERRHLSVVPTIPAIKDPSATVAPGTLTPSDIESNQQINLNKFRADSRFAGIDGRGFSTVIIDTAIDLNSPYFGPDADHNGVADRIVYSYDFSDSNDADASGTNDHGSNVASIVAGQSNTLYSGSGMAPGANIIFLKVFPDSGGGAAYDDIQEALQWTNDHVSQYNIASVNLSLGSGNYSSAQAFSGTDTLFASLASKGVMVCAASGNAFYENNSVQGVAWPASDPNVLSVSAVEDANLGSLFWQSGAIDYSTDVDRILSFSQRSTTLTDIYAPGGAITGANASGGSIVEFGTSQATPHITGIAVLAQQLAVQTLGRRLTYTEFRSLLRSSAHTINDGDDEDDNVTNTGANVPRVDVFALGEAILAMAPHTTGSIGGIVFNDADGNGSQGTGEAGVNNVTVYSDTNNDSIFESSEPHGVTGSGGAYAITGLAAGTYKIRQVLPANTAQTSPTGGAGAQVVLTSGQNKTGVNFGEKTTVVVTGGSVSGTVTGGKTGTTIYLDFDNDAVLDSSELRTTIAANGTYGLTNVPAGAYVVRQVLPSGYTQVTPASNKGLHVTVTNGGAVTAQNFTDKGSTPVTGGSVSGTVTGGKPGTTIYLDFDNDSVLDSSELRTTTASNGTYGFANVPAGAYVVRQVLTSGVTQVTPAGNKGLHVTVTNGGSVTGQNFTDKTSSTTVTTTLQAETATLAGGTVKATKQSGYTGTGYADFGGQGSSAKFTFTASAAGPTTLAIRYSNGGSTSLPFSVIVNGVTIGSFPGTKTGVWNSWATETIAAQLKSGSNTIQLIAGSAGGGDLDWLSYTHA